VLNKIKASDIQLDHARGVLGNLRTALDVHADHRRPRTGQLPSTGKADTAGCPGHPGNTAREVKQVTRRHWAPPVDVSTCRAGTRPRWPLRWRRPAPTTGVPPASQPCRLR